MLSLVIFTILEIFYQSELKICKEELPTPVPKLLQSGGFCSLPGGQHWPALVVSAHRSQISHSPRNSKAAPAHVGAIPLHSPHWYRDCRGHGIRRVVKIIGVEKFKVFVPVRRHIDKRMPV